MDPTPNIIALLGELCGQVIPANPLLGTLKYGQCARDEIQQSDTTRQQTRTRLRQPRRRQLLSAFGHGRRRGPRAQGFRYRRSRSNPNLAEAYIWKGVALRKANRDAEARQAFERALQLDPNRCLGQRTVEQDPRSLNAASVSPVLGINRSYLAGVRIFPGHTYLEADTQIYLPILERLDAPGFLSRDLVATHPNVAYTIYDEVTLFLHEAAQLDFRAALTAQQLVAGQRRYSAFSCWRCPRAWAICSRFLIAALLNLGAALTGPAVLLVDREAVARAFAFGLILLAAGLIAREKPFLRGWPGAWPSSMIPPSPPRSGRWSWWRSFSIAACGVFSGPRSPFCSSSSCCSRIWRSCSPESSSAGFLQHHFGTVRRAPAVSNSVRLGVGFGLRREIWHYLAIFVCGIWATARIWPALNRQVRWLFARAPALRHCECAAIAIFCSIVCAGRLFRRSSRRERSFIPSLFRWHGLRHGGCSRRASAKNRGSVALVSACLRFPDECPDSRLIPADQLRPSVFSSLVDLTCLRAWLLIEQTARDEVESLRLLVPLAAIFVMPRTPAHAKNTPKMDAKPIARSGRLGRREHLGQLDVSVSRCRTRALPGSLSRRVESCALGRLEQRRAGSLLRIVRRRMVAALAGNHAGRIFTARLREHAVAPHRLLRLETRKPSFARSSPFFKIAISWFTIRRRSKKAPGLRCRRRVSTARALVVQIDAELLQFLGVVALVENVVLFPAFGDVAFLRLDLLARGLVDAVFQLQQVGHLAHQRKAKFVRIFANPEIARFAHSGHNLVRQLVHPVARQLHRDRPCRGPPRASICVAPAIDS